MVARAWLASLALCAAGCSDDDPMDPYVGVGQAERCAVMLDEEARPERALAIGGGEPFVAFADGDAAPVVLGFQGAYMVTPRLRVVASEETEPEACWRVELDHELDAVGPALPALPGLVSYVKFLREDDAYTSGELYDALAYSSDGLAGRTLRLDATITAPTFEAAQSLELTLALVP